MDGIQILIVLALLPSILLGWYIYKNDKVEKEPGGLLFKLFFSGLGSVVLTLIFTDFIDLFIPSTFNIDTCESVIITFIYVFFTIALVEEGSKYIMVRLCTWKSKEYKHVYDGIVYCVFVSLGFATIENIMYIIQYQSLSTAILRGLMAVPGHVFDAIAMGHFYGLAKEASVHRKREEATKYNLLSLFIPALFHGIYDGCLFANNDLFVLVFFAFLIFLYIYSFKTVKKVAKVKENFIDIYTMPVNNVYYNVPNGVIMQNPTITPNVNQVQYQNVVPVSNQVINNENIEHDIYCPKCGTKYDGDFCAKCGNRRN